MLPHELPTFYVDGDNYGEDVHSDEDLEAPQLQPPSPPPALPPALAMPTDLKTLVADMVKLEMMQQVQEVPPASGTDQRKENAECRRKRIPVKVEKPREDADDEDLDSDVEFVQQSIHQHSPTNFVATWPCSHTSIH